MTDLKKLKVDALLYPEQARGIKVTDTISLNSANTFLVSIKGMRKEINNAFDPIIKKAHDSHKEALATKKRFDEPLRDAEDIIKPQIALYMAELARKQRELEEAAKNTERERIRKEEEQLEAAIQAEEAGDAEKMDEILAEEIPEVSAIKYTPAPKLEGTSIRKIWRWKVIDSDKIPNKYMIVNSNIVSAEVRKNKGETNIPGIKVYPGDIVSTRG